MGVTYGLSTHVPGQRERTSRSQPKALGRRRWVSERTMSWLTGYRRLNHRYERRPRNYLAFLGLAAAICCYKRLIRLTA
nr:transposase [Streptomyces sp. NBC_01001]